MVELARRPADEFPVMLDDVIDSAKFLGILKSLKTAAVCRVRTPEELPKSFKMKAALTWFIWCVLSGTPKVSGCG